MSTDISHRLSQLESRHESDKATLDELDLLVRGSASLNLRDRVLILWHSQLWILALASAVVGSVLQKLLGIL
jgi:hypothetical protein